MLSGGSSLDFGDAMAKNQKTSQPRIPGAWKDKVEIAKDFDTAPIFSNHIMKEETLDDLLEQITPENQHPLLLDGPERGKENWVWEASPPPPSSPRRRGPSTPRACEDLEK